MSRVYEVKLAVMNVLRSLTTPGSVAARGTGSMTGSSNDPDAAARQANREYEGRGETTPPVFSLAMRISTASFARYWSSM